ncbi:MAG: class I SAM-dependent methyltransferase [Deltaproteobacteria bacterium]|nr:class I SAM-dependent methyltransferase [Candidatus Anaeroferrophillacea bacterium]
MDATPDPQRPEFWRRYAAERRQRFENRKVASAEKWDGLADHYRKFEHAEDFVADQQQVIDRLAAAGMLGPETSVIDVACGPGTHCTAFCERCRDVVGVDVAPKMIARLEEKKTRLGLENLEVVCADFFTYTTDRNFDLVFVSMSPILNDLAAVDRLLALSKRYVALVYWAGVRDNPLYNHCYRMIYGEDFVWDPLDVTVIFNYLYSLGLAPEISYQYAVWHREETLARIIEHVIWHLEFYRPLTADEKERVKAYLTPFAAADGQVRYNTRVRKGTLLLDKQAGDEVS